MRPLWIIFLVLGSSACSHGPVRCDGHLTAINAPDPRPRSAP
jgi:hypothetical protein